MSNIEVLNHAISILKCECENHRYCEECPLNNYEYDECVLNTTPYEWKKLKE